MIQKQEKPKANIKACYLDTFIEIESRFNDVQIGDVLKFRKICKQGKQGRELVINRSSRKSRNYFRTIMHGIGISPKEAVVYEHRYRSVNGVSSQRIFEKYTERTHAYLKRPQDFLDAYAKLVDAGDENKIVER